ncbi:MAG: hypothetical protein RLZZ15_560 [Verrucomicrobiota bacterium]|jgi:hypothetical protein
MILQIDAWNIRERDAWGQPAKCRRRSTERERWHWVDTGTCFRLDHRGHALLWENRAPLQPLVRQLKNDSAAKVVRQLGTALAALPAGPARATVQT